MTPLNFLSFFNLYVKNPHFFGSNVCETAHLSWSCSQGTILLTDAGIWILNAYTRLLRRYMLP